MNSHGWTGDLTGVMGQVAGVATGEGALRVISAGARLALALPADRRAARAVVELYQPQRWKGRIFRTVARTLVESGVARSWPNFRGAAKTVPEASWLREPAAAGAVGFLGCNPVHGWRCVLAGMFPGSGDLFIAKLGIGASSAAIRAEAGVLECLGGRHPGVIPSQGLESAATANAGADGDWALLRLPHLGSSVIARMGDPRIARLLHDWLADGEVALGSDPWAAALLDRVPSIGAPQGWHEEIAAKRVRRALMHGDFAVWNLRVVGSGICAFDWEWAVERGIAGVDLAHGLRQEACMVRRLSPERAAEWILNEAGGPQWAPYFEASAWAGDLRNWLRFGLLHSHFNTMNESAALLKVLGIDLTDPSDA